MHLQLDEDEPGAAHAVMKVRGCTQVLELPASSFPAHVVSGEVGIWLLVVKDGVSDEINKRSKSAW